MNDRIRHLMEQIESLEGELNKALQEQQVHLTNMVLLQALLILDRLQE